MALLAEELIEEWLRRQGYFTIRGLKIGVHEIDLLAVKPQSGGGFDCRHVEVQVSIRPVSYISRVPKDQQRVGRAANSAKRSPEEMETGVSEWVHTKFERPDKIKIMKSLCPGEWTRELVVHKVKSEPELSKIAQRGVRIHRLNEILAVLSLGQAAGPFSASGADFVDLIGVGLRLNEAK